MKSCSHSRGRGEAASALYTFLGSYSVSGCDQCHAWVASKVNLALVIRRENVRANPRRGRDEVLGYERVLDASARDLLMGLYQAASFDWPRASVNKDSSVQV